MNKTEYLKQSINSVDKDNLKNWLYGLFSLIIKPSGPVYNYRVEKDPSGYYCNINGERIKIEDATGNDPLFKHTDTINITDGVTGNYISDKPLETTVGRLILNKFILGDILGNRIPYINKKFNIKDINNMIAPLLISNGTERTNNSSIYVHEYIQTQDKCLIFTSLSSIIGRGVSKIAITKAPGITEYKNKLLKEYEGKLHDPVVLSEFEKKLQDYDDNYLKNDPAYGTVIKGKVKNIGRKKMFVTFGAERTFEDRADVIPITNSLEEGWDTSETKFKAYIDALRAGSYARGAETENGGVASKTLLRALNSFSVLNTDCGTKSGLTRSIKNFNYKTLVGRKIASGGKWTLIETKDVAKKYVNSDVIVRSPMYCKTPGDKVCVHCMGEYFIENPNAVISSILDISNVLMAMFMAAMHGKELSTAKYELEDAFS